MFDTLTRAGLYALHTSLYHEAAAIHYRMMALPSALGNEWRVLEAKHGEVSETMRAVYAEIDRRDQEAAADA